MNGIINLNKEKGYTSQDAISIIKKYCGKKIGHAGTLDPEAEGVLIALLGKATKLSDYIMAESKEYLAELTLGIKTDSYDHTGNVLETKPVCIDSNQLMSQLDSFCGVQYQTPPMHSAIKINGQKLYKLARQGKEVHREARKIEISSIKLLQFDGIRALILVNCGKGTYIRSLCNDIGEALGCGGHMSSLVRTKSGGFSIETAVTLEQIKQYAQNGEIHKIIIPINHFLESYEKAIVSNSVNKILFNGGKIEERFIKNPPLNTDKKIYAVYNEDMVLAGIYELVRRQEGIYLKPKTMLPDV